jgi:hypothetical protein
MQRQRQFIEDASNVWPLRFAGDMRRPFDLDAKSADVRRVDEIDGPEFQAAQRTRQ